MEVSSKFFEMCWEHPFARHKLGSVAASFLQSF